MKELKDIFDRLGMNDQNGLYIIAEKKWQKLLPARIEWLIKEKLKPAAFFCIEKKPIVLFYDSPKPEDREILFKAIWNFNESPVVIINEANTIEIFNGFSYLKNEKALEKLGDGSNLNLFSYFELVTGKTWKAYEKKFEYQKRVDYNLLENIKSAREKIKKYEKDSFIANALIGKCIFIRYLIDRKVRINFDGNLREWTNDEFCTVLKDKKQTIKFLKYLKDHFNGEAFIVDDANLNNVSQKVFEVLSELLQGTKISTGQLSLFDIYDFSIIPVEFISNVYEHFIGSENQAEKGAYYTPLFLVNYIISETIEKYFTANPKEYNCKILDPACGSGVFLVEALRRMIERYLDPKINNTSAKTEIFKSTLKKIAEDNIFGIDEDPNAINVAIFSVYLALLDYIKDPKDIENFKFPKLITNKNFITNDFFDQTAPFNNKFKKIKFDFILGNPPWKRGSDKKALFLEYIEQRKGKEFIKRSVAPQLFISNNEIAQAFLLRTSDFSTSQTRCSLIVTSKTLYNLNAKKFRLYFLHNYFIDKVFELASVRKEVFDKSNDPSVAPSAILFFHYAHGEITDKNIIEHIALKPNRFFTLFKIFTIQKNDYKQIVQSRLKEYDWLWKVLVYGSYLDFNFIKRLKEEYKTIENIIEEKKYLKGQGIQYGQDKNSAKELLGLPIIDVQNIHPYYMEVSNKKFSLPDVHRSMDIGLFHGNKLLVKKGLNTEDLKSTAAISYGKGVFKDSLTAIKVFHKTDIKDLKIFCGLLQSDLFSYFIIQTGSSAGIEREQGHNVEKFVFPYIDNLNIANSVEKIEATSKKLFKEKQELLNLNVPALDHGKQRLINNMNDEILKSFDLNEQEKALIDYAVTITIPLIMKNKGYEENLFYPLKLKDPFLGKYVEAFLSRFKNSFEKNKKTFTVQVLRNNYIIGMFFNVTDATKKIGQVTWEDKSEKDLMLKLLSLGCQKITEKLFIQKDIRGFEKDGFYVIKPNEKKLWHKAMAYLDAEEFFDAILRAGREAGNE